MSVCAPEKVHRSLSLGEAERIPGTAGPAPSNCAGRYAVLQSQCESLVFPGWQADNESGEIRPNHAQHNCRQERDESLTALQSCTGRMSIGAHLFIELLQNALLSRQRSRVRAPSSPPDSKRLRIKWRPKVNKKSGSNKGPLSPKMPRIEGAFFPGSTHDLCPPPQFVWT